MTGKKIKLRREKEGLIARKLIHYSAVSTPLIYYYFLEKPMALQLLLIVSFIVVFSDLLRMIGPRSRKIYLKLFGWMTKKKELRQEFTGASYMLVGSLVVVLVFPKNIAVISLLFLTVGDPTACLIGTFFGRVRTFEKKTLEGSLAFLAAGLLASLLVPEISFLYKLIAATFAASIEMLPLKIDDNFTIPLTSGMILAILTGTLTII
ncbi:MAG: phosphatidate cytidylyltransferase [Candidatus Marinimicrobia bacterium]|nr:phosphatidate cytidylyltransferase [Candidatus Neomarinimicrobiota bacterium]